MATYGRAGVSSHPTESTRLLEQSLRTAQETSDLARLTNLELHRQEEKLNEAIDHTRGVEQVMEQTRDILQDVRCRRMTRSVYLWLICGGLTIINFVLIVVMFYNGGKLYPRHHSNDLDSRS